MYKTIRCLLGGLIILHLFSCGSSATDQTTGKGTVYNVFDYIDVLPGEIRVYNGTWDTNDIRIEVAHKATEEFAINGTLQTTHAADNYNYNEALGSAGLIYTSYAYFNKGIWTLWKEVEANGVESIRNFALFSGLMQVGDIVTSANSSAELLEASQAVFPKLSSTSLEYLKFKFSFSGGGIFFIVYYVKGYGEYVLQANSENINNVQKYLIYRENSSGSVGTKPSWFDGFVSSRSIDLASYLNYVNNMQWFYAVTGNTGWTKNIYEYITAGTANGLNVYMHGWSVNWSDYLEYIEQGTYNFIGVQEGGVDNFFPTPITVTCEALNVSCTTSGTIGGTSYSFTLLYQKDSVTVPAGTYNDCIKETQTDNIGSENRVTWYCNGIGKAKEIKLNEFTSELTGVSTLNYSISDLQGTWVGAYSSSGSTTFQYTLDAGGVITASTDPDYNNGSASINNVGNVTITINMPSGDVAVLTGNFSSDKATLSGSFTVSNVAAGDWSWTLQ